MKCNGMSHSLDDSLQEIDTDRLLVVPGEKSFTEALNHARFAYGSVAHDHHLNQPIHHTKIR